MLCGNFDAEPLRMALQRRPNLWNEHTYRTSFEGTPFKGMDDILLRYSRPEKHEGISDANALVNDTMLVQYPPWGELPEAHEVVFNLMRRYKGIMLGRVIIARLPMGGTIKPHADNYGAYAARDDGLRFHAVVNAAPGCLFHCGDETIQTRSGEVWWFQHREVHSAENQSADDRIHLLIDMQVA
jgi:hypothetical protein